MKHLISTTCLSHRNDHRTSSIDCDLHKLLNIVLCQLRNLKYLLSLSLLITISNILSGVLSMIAFYLTFHVVFLLHYIVLYSVYVYRIVAIQPFGCNTVIKLVWIRPPRTLVPSGLTFCCRCFFFFLFIYLFVTLCGAVSSSCLGRSPWNLQTQLEVCELRQCRYPPKIGGNCF